jgi:hypothetical protein
MDIELKFRVIATDHDASISACTLGDDQSYDDIIQEDRICRWQQNDIFPGSVDGFGSPPVARRRPDDLAGGSENDGEIVEKLTLLEVDKVERRYRTMDTMPKPARRSVSPSHRFRQNIVETIPKPARRSVSPSHRFRQNIVETIPKPARRSISPSRRFRQKIVETTPRRVRSMGTKEVIQTTPGRWSVSPTRKLRVSQTMDAVSTPRCRTISPSTRPQQAILDRTPPCSRGSRSRSKAFDSIPRPAHRSKRFVQGKRVSLDAPPSAAQRRSSRSISGVDAFAGAAQLHSILSPAENNNDEDSEESSVSTAESVFFTSDEESE